MISLPRHMDRTAEDVNATSPQQDVLWWTLDPGSTLSTMHSNENDGLDESEVQLRQRTVGLNVLRSHGRRSSLSILIGQFRSLIVGLLVVACVVALYFGETLEAVAVAVVIVVNTIIGFVTESRAIRSMEALRSLGRTETRVIRSGRTELIDAEMLVPGDIVVLEGGDVVTADLRIVKASKLQADESLLTGESVPVSKDIGRGCRCRTGRTLMHALQGHLHYPRFGKGNRGYDRHAHRVGSYILTRRVCRGVANAS